MIPDKIYCGNNGHGNLSYSTEKVYPSMEEYIRKDALLEWANEALAHLSDGSLTGFYESLVYQDIIDKLNSM
ncbi:MAG: hypothetical protein IK084_06730 [Bacteroidaceae bacterium]|nr:hypothetical protein [Bacteroidaceae bacterium]